MNFLLLNKLYQEKVEIARLAEGFYLKKKGNPSMLNARGLGQ
jgi:hypothetical protein